jgi:hypothetical protein
MAKAETAIVPIEKYELLKTSPEEMASIIATNAGPLGVSEFDFDRVTVPAGGGIAWELQTLEGAVSAPHIDCVVVSFKDVRSMWRTPMEESGGGPPDCTSQDCITGIGDPGGDCFRCPLAQFGSADKGRGQKCNQKRLLVALQPDAFIPMIIQLPPTSLKNCKKFFMRMSNERLNFYDAILRLTLTKDRNSANIEFAKVEFAMKAKVPEELRPKIAAYAKAVDRLMSSFRYQGDEDVAHVTPEE